MELFQEGQQVVFQGHIAGTNPDFTQIKIHQFLQLLLTLTDAFAAAFGIGKQDFSLFGETDALGSPLEEGNI